MQLIDGRRRYITWKILHSVKIVLKIDLGMSKIVL